MKKILVVMLTISFLSNSSDSISQRFIEEVDELFEINVKKVFKSNENCYSAILNSGDFVNAMFLDAGPAAGEYHCTRHDIQHGITIPLRSDRKYFDMLKRIYEAKTGK